MAHATHQHLSHLAGARKPEADYYRAGLRALDAQPGEVLFVDDRADNLAGAAALGIHVEMATTLDQVEAALARHNVLLP
jgi:putative hydrolase of the HAD superfamily